MTRALRENKPQNPMHHEHPTVTMDLYYVLTGVTARLGMIVSNTWSRIFSLWIPNRTVVEHEISRRRSCPRSDEQCGCDSLRVRTANANYADSTFARGRGDSRNRVLFIHRKAVSS